MTPTSTPYAPRSATLRDPDRPTLGDLTLAHLARLKHSVPFSWQWDVAEVAGELNDTLDGFHYPVVILSVPRRAGKTLLALSHSLATMDHVADCRAWYTANRRETATSLFRDEIVPVIQPVSHLYRIRLAAGSEGLLKRRGSSRWQIFSPNRAGLHSANCDVATVDEAWAFDLDGGEEVEAGMKPAQLTRPWRQRWYISAGGEITSTWWDQLLILGESGAEGVCFFDYGALVDDDAADPATWLRAHPTAGVAFPVEVLAHEWATRSSDESFERAYLNRWPRPSVALAAGGLDLDQWRAAATPAAAIVRVVAIGLDVSADRSRAALAVSGLDTEGRTVVEVVDARGGVSWLTASVRALRKQHRGAVVVADSLVAASVVAELKKASVAVDAVGASDHARACGAFVDALADGRLLHRSQAVLDDAVMGAARRPIGDAWLWSRQRSSVDIAPLVACTLAAWAVANRRPSRPAAVVVPNAAKALDGRPGVTRTLPHGHPQQARPRRVRTR